MRIFLALALFFTSFGVVEAYRPVLLPTQSQLEVIVVEDPEIERTYHSLLEGFPHTYEFTSDVPFELFVEVLIPDIDEIEREMSAIIVREATRGVAEVARLKGGETTWVSFYEPVGGNRYERGPGYESRAEAGSYIVQVHTAENYGKYALTIGKKKNSDRLGYFELLGLLIDVKQFFGKSPLMIVQSPFVYVPIGLFLLTIFGYRWRRKVREESLGASPIVDTQ